jgi:hypothetical protein
VVNLDHEIAVVGDQARITTTASGGKIAWLLWIHGEPQFDSSGRWWSYQWSRWEYDCRGQMAVLESHRYADDRSVVWGGSYAGQWVSVVPESIADSISQIVCRRVSDWEEAGAFRLSEGEDPVQVFRDMFAQQ